MKLSINVRFMILLCVVAGLPWFLLMVSSGFMRGTATFRDIAWVFIAVILYVIAVQGSLTAWSRVRRTCLTPSAGFCLAIIYLIPASGTLLHALLGNPYHWMSDLIWLTALCPPSLVTHALLYFPVPPWVIMIAAMMMGAAGSFVLGHVFEKIGPPGTPGALD